MISQVKMSLWDTSQLRYKMSQLPWCHQWSFPSTYPRPQAPTENAAQLPGFWPATCPWILPLSWVPFNDYFLWLFIPFDLTFPGARASWVVPPWVKHCIPAPPPFPCHSLLPPWPECSAQALACLGGGTRQKELRVRDCESGWQGLARWPRPSHLPLGFSCLIYLIQAQELD